MDSFIEYLTSHNLTISESALDCFIRYADSIVRFNKSMNLVASREVENLWLRHFADSLSPIAEGILPSKGDVLDIGSGAGLPGIPLAIMERGLNITMAESNTRKARFISRTIEELSLENAGVFSDRFERIEEAFDFVLIRAVFSDYNILPSIVRVIRNGGTAIFYKGRDFSASLPQDNMLDEIGLSHPRIIHPSGLSGERVLVVFERLLS